MPHGEVSREDAAKLRKNLDTAKHRCKNLDLAAWGKGAPLPHIYIGARA